MEKPSGFKYEFTYHELKYFLFDKGKCPRCGTKMDRFKDFELISGREANHVHNRFFRPDSLVKRYAYRYRCPACGFSKTLSELAEDSRRR